MKNVLHKINGIKRVAALVSLVILTSGTQLLAADIAALSGFYGGSGSRYSSTKVTCTVSIDVQATDLAGVDKKVYFSIIDANRSDTYVASLNEVNDELQKVANKNYASGADMQLEEEGQSIRVIIGKDDKNQPELRGVSISRNYGGGLYANKGESFVCGNIRKLQGL